jgi:hypothetical protein
MRSVPPSTYIARKTPSCPTKKPWGVFNKQTGTLNNRCHSSRAKALAQMRAIYASESGKMNSEQAVVSLVKSFSDEWIDGDKKWVKVYPFSSWTHPLFSDTTIDEETATALKESFDGKYYGEQEYVVSYDHGLDPAKGGKAAGWYEQVEVRDDGLWGLIRFTETAREEISKGEWRYFSGEHYDEWENPHTGEVHNLVFSGGALTNKPYVKEGMVPLNFSDVYVEKMNSEVNMDENPVVDEHVPEEHADPDTNQNPPLEGANTDDSEGSRVDTPPFVPLETPVDARLREVLGLDPDADIIKAVENVMAEVKPMREAAKEHSERKSFAERYPAEAAKLARLEAKDKESNAKAFSEQFRMLHDDGGKPTNKGFPAVVINKLEEVHKKFSEGNANVVDFTEVVELIGKTGMVDFAEQGSSRTDSYMDNVTPKNSAKAFADKVLETQENDQVDYNTATKITAEKYPDLFDAYQASIPGRNR